MELQIFNFEERSIRTAINNNGEVVIVAKDICDILGIENAGNVYSRLDEDERGIHTMDTLSGKQDMVVVNESGLYSIVLQSKKPEAKKFKKWITSEVLPSIRKTGSYSIQKPKARRAELSEASSIYSSLKSVAKAMGLTGNQLTISVSRATRKITDVDFQNLLDMNEIVNEAQERNFTPTEAGKDLGLSGQRANKELEELGFQEKKCGLWLATEKGKDFAVVLDTAKKHSDGTPITQLKWKESILPILRDHVKGVELPN